MVSTVTAESSVVTAPVDELELLVGVSSVVKLERTVIQEELACTSEGRTEPVWLSVVLVSSHTSVNGVSDLWQVSMAATSATFSESTLILQALTDYGGILRNPTCPCGLAFSVLPWYS